ncbi:MAG: ABC transporter permease, partial [Planctomycetota bacterium]
MRYGLRQLRKSPGFTVVAVLSLALGIGANTAIFSMINGILLKSLPVPNPQELRLINWTSKKTWPDFRRKGRYKGEKGKTQSGQHYGESFPYPAYLELSQQVQGWAHLFAFASIEDPVGVRSREAVLLANGQMVSGNFFEGYGAGVLLGRPIAPADDHPDAPPVTVISYGLWQRAFGLDPHVIGRTLQTEHFGFTVVGVLPRHYVDPLASEQRADFYVPLVAQDQLTERGDWLHSDDVWWVQMMGRLSPDVDEDRIQASLGLLFSQVVRRSSDRLDRPGIWLQKGRRGVQGNRQEAAQPLWFLLGMVGLVLLIACTNLAGLLLARGAARRHEMSVRMAMGAGRWRLMRQALTESMILSCLGICVGLMFAVWIRAALSRFLLDPNSHQHFDLTMDTRVLLFTLAIGALTTLLSGLLPAWSVGKGSPLVGLRENRSFGTPRLHLRRALLAGQVGLSLVLVVIAALLCQSLINLYQIDPGIDTEHILLVTIHRDQSLSPDELPRRQLYRAARRKIAGIPGVRSVALSDKTLLEGDRWDPEVSVPSRPQIKETWLSGLCVSDGYFETMGIKLLAGRDFRASETQDSTRVAVVNQAFADLYFPDESPLDQFITVGKKQRQIVGLCSNHRYVNIRRSLAPIVYIPNAQTKGGGPDMTLAVRSDLPPRSLVPAIRKAVADVDPDLPASRITTQKQIIEAYLAEDRLNTYLCISFAVLAVSLSCIGLYGIVTYTVVRRTGEIGIRLALGARPWDVAWSVIRGALALTAMGVALGLPVALLAVRLLRSVVYGVKPQEPLTRSRAAALMMAIGLVAAWIPARRAAN